MQATEVDKLAISSFIFLLEYNFEDTVTHNDNDMFRKNLSLVQALIIK